MNNTDLKVTALEFAYKLEQKDAQTALESAKVIYEWLKDNKKPQPVLDKEFL